MQSAQMTRTSLVLRMMVPHLGHTHRRVLLFALGGFGAPVWLLDEPGNGLDIASVALLEGLIAGHRAAGGIALVATHLPLALPDAREVAL